MSVQSRERWGATSGFAALIAGVAGGALERGWPSGHDTVAVASFIVEHRSAILGQSALFLISSALYLWFLGCLRARLVAAEGGPGRISAIVFGAGLVWIALGMVAQAFQIGQVMAAPAPVLPAMMWTMAAVFAIANLPCAVMLVGVAVVTWRHAAFPAWLGTIAFVAATAQLLLFAGAVVSSGPLAPNGWLTYVLYPSFVIWLLPTIVWMVRRRERTSRRRHSLHPPHFAGV